MSALVPVSEAGVTGITMGMKNAYVYEDGERMEKINDELRTKYLALPPAQDDNSVHDDISSVNGMASVMGGKEESKHIDMLSERSIQLTQISKRSGISTISHSVISKLSKPISLPKEKILREQAEDKLYKSHIKEIDSCLHKVHSESSRTITEDQMSRLVEECRRDNERAEMREVEERDEDDEGEEEKLSHNNSQALVLYGDENTKLSEAQHLLDILERQKEAFDRGDFLAIQAEMGEGDQEIDEEEEFEKLEKYDAEENDLKRRLQEQEDNLAEIMKEIEEKEMKLKQAIEENNKFLEMQSEMEMENGEISTSTAAYKFSSARGNAFKPPKKIKNEIPDEKVIEELPEESEDEESYRLDEMIDNAKHFNEEFDNLQSSKDFYDDIDATQRATDSLVDENIRNYYERETEEEAKEESNPNDDM
jgi:hypothetical protein